MDAAKSSELGLLKCDDGALSIPDSIDFILDTFDVQFGGETKKVRGGAANTLEDGTGMPRFGEAGFNSGQSRAGASKSRLNKVTKTVCGGEDRVQIRDETRVSVESALERLELELVRRDIEWECHMPCGRHRSSLSLWKDDYTEWVVDGVDDGEVR